MPSTIRLSSLSQSAPTDEVTSEERCRKSWKYIGYLSYSKFVASDSDLLVLRRFGILNARIALALQNRLSELEEELGNLDKLYSSKSTEDVHNGSFRDDQEDRERLIWEIHSRLREYS